MQERPATPTLVSGSRGWRTPVAALTSTPSVDAIREEVTGELQAGLDARIGELDARLSANAADGGQRDDKLRKRIDRLAESLAAVEGTIPNAESLRDEIAAGLHGGLEARVGELRHELQSSQAHASQTSAAAHESLRERVEALAASLEPLSGAADRVEGLRHELAGDLHSALESRIGEVQAELEAGRAEHDARQAARAEADTALRERVDGLAAAMESVAGTPRAVESLRHELATSQANVHALHGELRSVADSVAVEAGRLIDTESRLAEGLEGLVHRLDAVETRVSGVETTVDATAGLDTVARDELERLALSLGHRLDGLEHALATGGVEALRASLEALEQRVDAQTGIVEEQSRVTERAVRKGLAALGERIADGEAAYVEAGSALRRSVERLGWAIEDADRVIAAPPVVSPEETGHVVFAPTAEGYRLVACEGVAAGVGDRARARRSERPGRGGARRPVAAAVRSAAVPVRRAVAADDGSRRRLSDTATRCQLRRAGFRGAAPPVIVSRPRGRRRSRRGARVSTIEIPPIHPRSSRRVTTGAAGSCDA